MKIKNTIIVYLYMLCNYFQPHMVNLSIIQFRASLIRSDFELLMYLNNQIQIF